MQQPRKARIGTAAALLLILVVLATAIVTLAVSGRLAFGASPAISELFDVLESHTLYDVEEETLFISAARGAVAALDDEYAEYYTAEEYTENQRTKSGKYRGIGLTFSQTDDGFSVVSVTEGGPSYRAGVLPGDLMLSIEGESLEEWTLNEISDKIKSFDAEFSVEFSRSGISYTVALHSEEIVVKRVAYQLLKEGVGYIRLDAFYGDAGTGFKEAVRQAGVDGVSGIILDLRDNLGGDLDIMMDIANELLDEKLVLTIKNGDGTEDVHRTSLGASKLKLVVLINGNSASASEALTGALLDNGRAVAIGTRTFGKGIVQTTYPLSTGGYVKLTTGEYFTPSGVSIHKKGITPSITVELKEGETMTTPGDGEYDSQLAAAVSALLKQTDAR